jgi:hypothetical protein
MAIWNFTLAGQSARRGQITFDHWDDGTGLSPSDAEFGEAEARARRLLAYLGALADTAALADGSHPIGLPQISYNPSTGTSIIKS